MTSARESVVAIQRDCTTRATLHFLGQAAAYQHPEQQAVGPGRGGAWRGATEPACAKPHHITSTTSVGPPAPGPQARPQRARARALCLLLQDFSFFISLVFYFDASERERERDRERETNHISRHIVGGDCQPARVPSRKGLKERCCFHAKTTRNCKRHVPVTTYPPTQPAYLGFVLRVTHMEYWNNGIEKVLKYS